MKPLSWFDIATGEVTAAVNKSGAIKAQLRLLKAMF